MCGSTNRFEFFDKLAKSPSIQTSEKEQQHLRGYRRHKHHEPYTKTSANQPGAKEWQHLKWYRCSNAHGSDISTRIKTQNVESWRKNLPDCAATCLALVGHTSSSLPANSNVVLRTITAPLTCVASVKLTHQAMFPATKLHRGLQRLTALPSTHPTLWVSNRAAPFTEWAVCSYALLQRHARLASHYNNVTTHMNRSGHQAPDLRLLLRSSPLWDVCRRLPGGHLELEEALSLLITRIGS